MLALKKIQFSMSLWAVLIVLSTLCFVTFAFPVFIYADVIYLKNGKQIKTSRSWRENGHIKCERFGGVVSYPISSIEKIEKSIPSKQDRMQSMNDINSLLNNKKSNSNVPDPGTISSAGSAKEIAQEALHLAAKNSFNLAVRQRAIEKIYQALVIDENEPWAYLALSMIIIQNGHKIGKWYLSGSFRPGTADAAIEAVNKAIELDPDFSEGYSFLAWFYIIKRDFVKANTLVDKAHELNPSSFYAWLYKGTIALLAGQPEDARIRFEEAALHSTQAYQKNIVRGRIRDIFQITGNVVEEENHLLEDIQLEPNNAYAYGSYANFLMCQGRAQESIPYWEKAISITPYQHAINRLEEARSGTSSTPCVK